MKNFWIVFLIVIPFNVQAFGATQPVEVKPPDVKIEPEKVKIDPVVEAASLKNPFIAELPIRKDANTQTSQTSGTQSGQTQTQSGEKKKEIPPNFTITGVVWNSDKPQAIINNAIVGPGQMIDTWKVLSIQEGQVKVASPLGTIFIVNTSFDKL